MSNEDPDEMVQQLGRDISETMPRWKPRGTLSGAGGGSAKPLAN